MKSLDRRDRSALFAGAATALALSTVAPCAAWGQAAPAPSAPATKAQPSAAATSVGEVLVTARRRTEQSIDVPVVETAFSGAQLARAGVQNLTDIAILTPQLTMERNVGSFGGAITLRGVASPTGNTPSETAVTINIDGVPLNNGPVLRLGQFDLGQVEILKGPQALFFGKNSSGGIVSLKSAEPTGAFESMARLGYETEAQEGSAEGVISGPISKDLEGRLAVKYNDEVGRTRNDAPGVAHPKGPGTRDEAVRGTLLYQPTDAFRVKLSGTYNDEKDFGTYFLAQRISCPAGHPVGAASSPTITDCTADNHMARGDLPSNVGVVSNDPLFGNGVPFSYAKQGLVALDANYQFSSGISLNSITGYYDLNQAYMDPIVRGPIPVLAASGANRKHTWSEEVRLSSDPNSGAFKWMVGGFYQNDRFSDFEHVVGFTPPVTLTPRPASLWHIKSEAWSGFGQASYDFANHLSLSAGARYTYEKKAQTVNLSSKFIPEIAFSNLSPEATLSYRATPDLNLFATYKQGYKSGGFQASSLSFVAPIANPAITSIDNSYRDETVRGFEGGAKANLFERTLRIDAVAYRYVYSNLQLSSFDPVLSVSKITNAAAAVVEGVELNAHYTLPEAPALQLFGSLAYNRARYQNFVAVCWVGQTIAQGCNIKALGAATPNRQDLSGRPLPRAPEWAGNIGFNYDHDIGTNYSLNLNAEGVYQANSFLTQEDDPFGTRPNTFLVNAGVAIRSRSGGWELAFIGKNLADKRYAVSGAQESFTGNAATTGTNAGSPSDFFGVINRGRELWLQLTIRPNLF